MSEHSEHSVRARFCVYDRGVTPFIQDPESVKPGWMITSGLKVVWIHDVQKNEDGQLLEMRKSLCNVTNGRDGNV